MDAARRSSGFLTSGWVVACWFALIIGVWIARSVPWNLEEYDQSKQAYTSYEMIERGAWWFQHTPRQESATKPPLVGWMSAGIYQLTHSWNVAWRLPSLLAAVSILVLLWKNGHRLAGAGGAFLATAAFAWNLLSLRLATMVRTDMVLACFIFLAGLLIWRRIAHHAKWTWRDTFWLTVCFVAATLTKGPIYHAFLLPGLAAWLFLSGSADNKRQICLGYLSASIVSLLPFLGWVWLQNHHDSAFYQQVVVKEFFGRFTVGAEAVHNNQTWYFYLPHLLAKTCPWSLFFVAALAFKQTRQSLKNNPATLWLICWTLGGLLAMSLVPSKRVDRIFPILPAAALGLAAMLPVLRQNRLFSTRILLSLGAAAVLGYGGYTGWFVWKGYQIGTHRLSVFANAVTKLCAANHWKYAIVEGRDEGLLLYTHQLRFQDINNTAAALKNGTIKVAVVDSKSVKKLAARTGALQSIMEVAHPSDPKYSYFLVRRRDAPSPSHVNLRGHILGAGHNPLTCPYCSVKPRDF